MRPRCCLRNLTFFGINIRKPSSLFRGCTPLQTPAAPGKSLGSERTSREALVTALLLLIDVATVDPGLDPDDAVSGVRLGKTVVDVGPQGVERQTALEVPLGASDLVSVETTGDADLDALAAEAERGVDRLAHGATEADAFLELQRDVLGNQLCVELGFVDLKNVNKHFTRRPLLNVGLELIDLGALAANDDARARGADDQAQLVAWTLDLDRADAGGLQLLAQLSLELDVFDQQFVIAALDKPTRLPRLVDAEAQPIRMDFLSHSFPLLVCPLRLSRRAVVQNSKFTRNCLLRGLFGCRFLGGCLLRGGLFGCRLCRCLLRGLLRCRGRS